ncbi:MAG: putative esterase of the alpha-beta hydrolase superfamily [Acidimicrobiales bacterium]|nr:putative esterase of the alpha-beta hydrolase superfamily [Acidimicrobiales bacterium]
MRIGLVLGAGGVVGHAVHAGVLAALDDMTGWDPRHAEVIVGTSAGAGVAALLRAGFSPGDLLARATDQPMSRSGARLLAKAEDGAPPPPLPPRPRPADLLGRMAEPSLLVRSALRPFRVRPGALAAAALPRGTVPPELVAGPYRRLLPGGWPDQTTWLCAVRLDTGRRVVFGREDGPPGSVADAVAASCAIPGYFAPVEIDGVRYVDGGVHSPTNADLVARLGLDLVIVSSSMSAAGRWRRAVPVMEAPVRAAASWYLGREVAAIRRHGTPVLVFQPSPGDLADIAGNAMDPARRPGAARQAGDLARRRLGHADATALVALLRRAA